MSFSWQNIYKTSRSMGDICKCKIYFLTLPNSLFDKPCLVDSCFANPLTDTYFSSQIEQSYILISGCFTITCLILSTLESKTSLH